MKPQDAPWLGQILVFKHIEELFLLASGGFLVTGFQVPWWQFPCLCKQLVSEDFSVVNY